MICGCGKYKGKYTCDGCGDDFGLWCGHCARPVFVVFIGHVMPQRLCPPCRLQGEEPSKNGIYDARHYTLKELRNHYERKK